MCLGGYEEVVAETETMIALLHADQNLYPGGVYVYAVDTWRAGDYRMAFVWEIRRGMWAADESSVLIVAAQPDRDTAVKCVMEHFAEEPHTRAHP